MKQITRNIADELILQGYLKNYSGNSKDLNISSVTKNGRGKTYWICEGVYFPYLYENEIKYDDKDYEKYSKNRKEKEERENRKRNKR